MLHFLNIGVCFAGAAACGFGAFTSLKKARTIEDIPTSKIRSAHQGYVELVGMAEAVGEENTLRGALSHQPCIWYDYRIERYQSGKKSQWVTVEKGESDTVFRLQDTTGECLVDPAGADVSTTTRRRWTGYERHPQRPASPSLLGRLLRQRYRYTERRILAGQPLYLVAWFETRQPTGREQQQRELSRGLLREWKQDQRSLLTRFDTDRDGKIDMREWEEARAEAWRESGSLVARRPQQQPVDMLKKPENGQPFLLSTSDPKGLAKRYRRKSTVNFILIVLLTALGSWFILQSLGGG